MQELMFVLIVNDQLNLNQLSLCFETFFEQQLLHLEPKQAFIVSDKSDKFEFLFVSTEPRTFF